MSRSAQKQVSLTKNIRNPNLYVQALYKEYKSWALDESEAVKYKSHWRELFLKNSYSPLHLEIGTGNGKHFSRLCLKKPEDCFLAIEIKYKALIQTARRIKNNNSQNGKVIRYNALLLKDLFKKKELNNVYIHFPDPWLKKKRQKKHQLIQEDFCKTIYDLQKNNSFLELKTDSEDYFHQSVERFKKAGYKIHKKELNLYEKQKPKDLNQLSQFELLFFQKEIPIQQAVFIKD